MKNFIEAAQYAFAALGGALGAVMGGFDGFLYALVVFVIVDYATGADGGGGGEEALQRGGIQRAFLRRWLFSALWRWGIS